MRSATCSRNQRSWLTTRNAAGSERSSRSSQRMPSRSRWFVGSSISSRSGARTSARAIASRFCQPPESVPAVARRIGEAAAAERRAHARVARGVVEIVRPRAPRRRARRRVRSSAKLGMLRHVARARVSRRSATVPASGASSAGEHAQQRRLAAAVRADEPDAVAVVDAERQVGEQRRRAVRLRDAPGSRAARSCRHSQHGRWCTRDDDARTGRGMGKREAIRVQEVATVARQGARVRPRHATRRRRADRPPADARWRPDGCGY